MILGISGLAGSGKDQFAKFLVQDHGFTVVSLADPLKRITRDIFDFTDEQLWGPSHMRNEPDCRYPRSDGSFLAPRESLQLLGTEFGRACYPDIWVEYALRTAHKILTPEPGYTVRYHQREGLTVMPTRELPVASPSFQGVAIPDVRFKNEIEGIRKAGGKVIRLRRDGAGLRGPSGLHPSETEQASIPDQDFDFVVENNNTLGALREKASRVFRALKEKI